MQMATFEISPNGTIKAWYDVIVPGYAVPDANKEQLNGTICFHLTDEGLIIDLFDKDGNCIDTAAYTSQEFSDFIVD